MHCVKGSGTAALLLATALACGATHAAGANKADAEGGFSHPAGIALDGADNMYVADTDNSVIRRVSATGEITTVAGIFQVPGHLDGASTLSTFRAPRGVAVDGAGTIYVADTGNDVIRKITPQGVVTTLAGDFLIEGAADGRGEDARFRAPTGIAADRAGNLYVADTGNHAIRKITPAGTVSTLALMPTLASAGSVSAPTGIALDGAGNIYVADRGHHVIYKITRKDSVATLAGSGLAGNADGTGRQASFDSPSGIALDPAGNLYVTDSASHTLRKITPAGVVTTLAGTAGVFNAQDGMRTAAKFFRPAGIAVARDGHLYVADSGNNAVRHITPAGFVTTFAGAAPAADESQKVRSANASPAASVPAASVPAISVPAASAPAASAPDASAPAAAAPPPAEPIDANN